MKREILSIMVVVIFFGLAIAPSINANIDTDDDFVELDVEFCGLGKKLAVRLTQDEYNEVRSIFDDMQEKLLNIENDEDVITIFNKGIVDLNKYGLLCGLSIEKAQRLITTQYQLLKNNRAFYSIFKQGKLNYGPNYLCLVQGNLTESIYQNPLSRLISILYHLLMNSDIFDLYRVIMCMLTTFQYPFILISYFIPFSLFSTITAGHVRQGTNDDFTKASKGFVYTYGKFGNKSWSGELWGAAYYIPSYVFVDAYYPAIPGFTGIKLYGRKSVTYFLGFGLKADFTSVCPYPPWTRNLK